MEAVEWQGWGKGPHDLGIEKVPWDGNAHKNHIHTSSGWVKDPARNLSTGMCLVRPGNLMRREV